MTIKDFIVNVGVKVDDSSVKTAESTVNNLKGTISKALKVIGISFSLTSINSLLEEWNDVNKVLNRVNTELGSAQEVQDKILESANACRMAYSDMADYVNDLTRSGSAFFSTAEEAADFLTTANQLFYVSGATESEISSLNKVITNTFTKGKMSASDFNTLMSACPEAVTILADSLGVTEQQLKALGTSGNITAKQLKSALTDAADDIADAYSGMSLTISDAITMIKNEWGTWLSQMDQTYNFTDSIARALVSAFEWLLGILQKIVSWWDRLVDLFGSTKAALEVIIGLAGTLYAIFKFDKIKSGISSITKAFNGFGGKIMLVVLAIVALILIIDDLVAFVNGDASVIGSLFDSAGISADGLRETLSALFDAVMDMLSSVMTALQPLLGVLGELLEAVLSLLTPLMNLVTSVLTPILKIVSVLVDLLMNDVMSALGVVTSAIDMLVANLGGFFDMVSYIVDAVSALFSGDWEDAWKSFVNAGVAALNWIISSFESMVNFCIKLINTFTATLSKAWTWLGLPAIPEIPDIQLGRLDYYAEGAYIEPDSPRLAVVGDNPNEGEYVAPESKLRNAVQEALALSFGDLIADLRQGTAGDADALAGIMQMAQSGAFAGDAGRRGAPLQTLMTTNNQTRLTQNIEMYNTFNQDNLSVQRETSQAMRYSADELVRRLAQAVGTA